MKTLLFQSNNKQFSFKEFELYWTYKNELWDLTGETRYPESEVKTWYFDWLRSSGYVIRIYDDSYQNAKGFDQPSQIGFVFIGIKENCHTDCDFYVQDAYLSPKFRNQHIMQMTMQKFIEDFPGKYCLFLIDSNLVAIHFWQSLFQKLGYHEFPIVDYAQMETPWCHQHAFQKGD